MSTTTTTWTGSDGADWDASSNWAPVAPTSDDLPIYPAEEALIVGGQPSFNDGTLDGMLTVALDGLPDAAALLDVTQDGAAFGPSVVTANTLGGSAGILVADGDFDNQGTLLADAPGGVLQVDPLTAGNALLRELWTSEGLLRATGGGTLEIDQTATTQAQENTANTLPEFDFFQNTGTILADDGGTVQLNEALGSQGAIVASGGTIDLPEVPGLSGIAQVYNALVTVPGPGVLYINNGGVISSAAGLGEPVYFTDSTGTLSLQTDSAYALPLTDVIEGFRPGDLIELPGNTISSLTYTFGQLTFGQPGTLTIGLKSPAGLAPLQLLLDGDYRQDVFSVAPNGSGIVVAAPPGTGATSDTVSGSGSATHSVAFGAAALAALAAPLLAAGTPAKTLFVDSAGASTLGSAQTEAVVDATGAVSVTGNAAAGELVAAGGAAFTFRAGSGSGSIIAGGGADYVYLPGGGNWLAALGNGTDSVVAAAGNDTIGTGTGGSFVFLGSGASSVGSGGADTILGGTGSSTVSALGANSDEAFAFGAPLQFIAGTGASTVVAGAQAATLFGGASGGTLMFGDGATQYWGSGATDTVLGLAGSLTVQGGTGGGLFFGGTAGHNYILANSGPVTAFGAGAGDVLIASGASADLFAGGVGAETLSGVGSTGNNTFFAGFGPDLLEGGAGTTALIAGEGSDLLVAGSGLTLFLLVAGRTAGGADTISGWNPAEDFVKLAGYTNSALQNATVANGSETIGLSDGTRITFAGITQLSASSFV